MSGWVRGRSQRAWTCASWVYGYVAREVAPSLIEGSDLRSQLELAEEHNVLQVDLSDYTPDEVARFVGAVTLLAASTRARGDWMADQRAFEGLCALLDELASVASS